MKRAEAVVNFVQPDSIAAEMEIEKGDIITSINGKPINDLIDYRYHIADDYLELRLLKKSGEEWIIDIEKEYDEDLGIEFEQAVFDSMKICRNKCVFCFVDQMPSGVRETLYVKDDDYRLSFLHGNFVTLTNLDEKDLERIARLRLSPLYVSVHTTNPELRIKMLNNKKAGKIREQLNFFREHGIVVHTQIVLCPGINDGDELERTLQDLIGLWPAVQSIAVVPVGLTRYRQGLFSLKSVSPDEADKLIDRLTGLQHQMRERYGKTLVYLSDEFYLIANRPIPSAEYYDDFEQLENGVGLVRLLYEDFEESKGQIPKEVLPPAKTVFVTSVLGQKAIQPLVDELRKVKGLFVETFAVENRFFGEEVTVTGLITGSDITAAFKERPVEADLVLIPAVMCRKEGVVFLDGMTPDQLEKEIGSPVRVVDVSNGLEELYNILF